jgi:hypothetical protein
MIEESRLRRIIRGILIREMKDTYWGPERGDMGRSKNMPEVSSMTPVSAALKLLTVAKNNSAVLGEELSTAIFASRHDPASLIALTRIARGQTPESILAPRADVESLAAEIERMNFNETSSYEPR